MSYYYHYLNGLHRRNMEFHCYGMWKKYQLKEQVRSTIKRKDSWLKFPAPWKNQERKVSSLHQSWLIGTLNLGITASSHLFGLSWWLKR